MPVFIGNNGSLYGASVAGVACGNYHTVAIDTAGRVHAWGRNSLGQLGDGTGYSRNSPVLVSM
jgi:alpha-tubulin suppressor-like RCC1 family protein